MIEGRPFLYQAVKGALYYVDEKGFNAVRPKSINADRPKYIRPWSSKGPIAAFIDGDSTTYEPHLMALNDHSVQIIVASSLKGASSAQTWIKQLRSRRDLIRLTCKLWSPKELFVTGLVLAFPSFDA